MSRAWIVLLALAAAPRRAVAPPAPHRSTPARQSPRAPRQDVEPERIVREAERDAAAGRAGDALARYEARLRRDGSDRAALLGAATIARVTYDYEAATERYRRLFDGAPLGDRTAVAARLGLAMALDANGRRSQLEPLLDSAQAGARLAGDRELEGAAHFWLANSLVRLRGGAFGLAQLDTALRVLPAASRDLRASSRCRRAQIMGVIGSPGARDTLAASLSGSRDANAPMAEAICWRALGTYHWIHEAMDSSLAAYDSAIAVHRRTRARSEVAVDLTLKADALRSHGDVGGALRAFQASLAEARASRNLYIEATVTLGLGGTSLTLNDHAAARAQVAEAVRAFDAAGDSAGAMMARSFLPFVSLAEGDYAGARARVADVMPWAERVGEWSHVTELYEQLATIEMRSGDWDAASGALDRARAAAHHLGAAEEGALAYSRGRLALARGDLTVARRELTAFLAGLDSTQHIQRYESRAYLAEVSARSGDLTAAERELRAASDELDAWRSSLDDAELRVMAFQAGATEANDRNAPVAHVLAALAGGGRANAALLLAERRRARELSDRLVQMSALRDSTMVADREAGPRRDSAARGDDWLAALPDRRTAVLEYVTGALGAPTTAFLLAPSAGGVAVRAHVLPPADSLVPGIARLGALVEAGAGGDALARMLGAVLLDPVLADLPNTVDRLIVVPDGPLHRVPWDALRTADGRFVLERYSVAVAPSIAVLRELRRRPAHTGRLELLAYGDPAYGPTSSPSPAGRGGDVVYRSAFDTAGGLPRLEASAQEAALVGRFADRADVRTRERASAAFLKHAPLDRYRVLHLATHAIVDDRAVTRTALAVAPGDGESGFLGPGDLAALPLDADLVVLSACRSAGGVVVDGEGVQGLTAPLLQAGARSVVATRWRIGDRETVSFVGDFYRAMAGGQPVGDALRTAKLAALRRGAPPRAWAAFTVVGDPFVSVPLHPPAPRRAWWLLLPLAGLGIVLYRTMRNRPTPDAR